MITDAAGHPLDPELVRRLLEGGDIVPAPGAKGVCPTCTHGALSSESLNADGSCPYRAIALAENARDAETRTHALIAAVTRAPFHLRPGARP